MSQRHTNILFVVADDLNAWIGALGRHPQAFTPNIDRLAARGALFTRAYCTAPFCNASRMSVFTGLLPSKSGIYYTEPFWDSERRPLTYFEALRHHGYTCHGAGKVFHGNFDYATAGRTRAPEAIWREDRKHEQVWDSFDHTRSEPMPPDRPLNGMFNFDDFENVSPWNHLFDWGVLPDDREAETPDARTVASAVKFLNDPPTDKPFLFAAGLYKPHLPWYAPKRFFDKLPIESIILPVVREDDLNDVADIARNLALSPPDHATVTRADQWRHAVRGYLAAIAYCDEQIGIILNALEDSPARDNTMIVLWGDNGFHLGEKLHWRKFVLWEEATRVPLIVVPPASSKIEPIRLHDPASLIDIFPTLFDIAGLEPIPNVDGVSLLPRVRGDAVPTRPALSTWKKGNHSVRFGHWRYTRYEDGSEELYDQATDPMEWTNIAADPQFARWRDEGKKILFNTVHEEF